MAGSGQIPEPTVIVWMKKRHVDTILQCYLYCIRGLLKSFFFLTVFFVEKWGGKIVIR